jgi:hypothetical protein
MGVFTFPRPRFSAPNWCGFYVSIPRTRYSQFVATTEVSIAHCTEICVLYKPLRSRTNQLCKFHQILQRQSAVVKRKFDRHTRVSLFHVSLFIFIICRRNIALCLQGQHKGDVETLLIKNRFVLEKIIFSEVCHVFATVYSKPGSQNMKSKATLVT